MSDAPHMSETSEARPSVRMERQGPISIIVLDKAAETRNAFDLAMRAEIARAVIEVRDDDSVKVVIITGSQGVFCAGGDLRALHAEKSTAYRNRRRILRLHPWFRELSNLEKPVIAAVDGPAFGAGFNLALACDFVLATPRARFCSVFGRVGLVPDLGGFYFLPRIVGLQRAKEIVFTAREIAAEEAERLGIVYAIHAEDQLLEAALTLARSFCDASTEAIGLAKNILNRSFNLDQDTLAELESYSQAVAMDSDYHEDAVQRFLTKQPLRFVWKRRS